MGFFCLFYAQEEEKIVLYFLVIYAREGVSCIVGCCGLAEGVSSVAGYAACVACCLMGL